MIKTKTNLLALFSILFLLISSSYSIAQEDGKKKEKKYKWGVSVIVNSAHDKLGLTGSTVLDNFGGPMLNNIGTAKHDKSLSIGGLLKYSLNSYDIIRFEFIVTNINMKSKSNFVQINKNYSNENTFKQNITTYNLGIQRSFKKDFFEIHGGLMLSYSDYRKISLFISHVEKNISTDSTTFWNTREFIVPGGFVTGFGGFIGFSFYLNKYFSLGAEISLAYCYVNMGGKLDDIQISQYPPNPILMNSSRYDESYQGFRFTKLNPSINANIYF